MRRSVCVLFTKVSFGQKIRFDVTLRPYAVVASCRMRVSSESLPLPSPPQPPQKKEEKAEEKEEEDATAARDTRSTRAHTPAPAALPREPSDRPAT
jgi:hypothetical protein